jgi:phosphoribosylamine-glycine ligase
MLVQILSPEEVDPTYDGRVNLIDSESVDVSDNKNMKIKITRSMQKAYEEAMIDFKKDIKTFCSKRGVDYVTISTENPIERVLFNELLKAGIMA